MQNIKDLFNLIKGSKYAYAFTGAGVSTLSGIPDFRGVNGVYNTTFEGYNPEEILHIDFFYKHPEIFYAWCKDVWYNLDEYKPNIVHKTLSKLEKIGYINGIITQNIDMLHTRAGSKKIYELHGSSRSAHCTKCNKGFSYNDIAPAIRSSKVPYCDKCKGLIKPDIVLYGEGLDSELLLNVESICKSCDLLLVLGSSLTVQPASILPELVRHYGGKVVIINNGATYADDFALMKLDDLKDAFEKLSLLIDNL